MRDHQILEARQTRIYASDKLVAALNESSKRAGAFRDRFGWAEVKTENDNLVFADGHLPDSEVPITRFALSDRRTMITTPASSEVTTVTHDALLASLFGETPSSGPGQPIIVVHETLMLVNLDFDWEELFSPLLVEFATDALGRELASQHATATISTARISIGIRYAEVDTLLAEHGISLAPKVLTVEPRSNVPLSERRYFTVSPTDTVTHLKLLTDLEARLVQAREGRT